MSVPEKERYRIRRARLSAAGVCINCGRNPRTETSKRCKACSAIANQKTGRYYHERRKMISQSNRIRTPEGGMTFEEIGRVMGCSRQGVIVVYTRALAKLHRECVRLGFDAGDIIGAGFSMIATAEKWAGE